ncbi:hypothetical protein GPECTOR_28g803 [Gonium pectorale]|uniref:Glycosyltransferase 61 catalytic domain-containing protein n=1 Tax=Gonium pectorale TaxID=33097 RepID=A0A150GEZ4_GONPE|nr:hypothetical protein GPECTOR_28g803 [Gonium pectorale]|eukprot:KXZ48396.1 hypothetical protein GPECTOR_28g803 [Gonium pectorale]
MTTSSQYVASIKDASVAGSEGDVWDSEGRLYRANTWVKHPVSKLEAWRKEAEAHGVKRFKRLATTIHRVSFMYYHFMTETMARIAKFAPLLKEDPELKLLTYGGSFERAWIQMLGINEQQLVTFDPLFAHHAEELLITNPVEIARTPREDLEAVIQQLGVPAPLPASQRTDVVYVSRRLASDRKQTNEEELLQALEAEAEAAGLRLVVHDGRPDLTAQDTIDMFRRAKVVMGPNGAGLAHMLFAAPGTPLVELMFINNTGMDLWHLTAALKQPYYMVPLPRSYWLDPGSDVPIEQAVATLRLALADVDKAEPTCPPGSAPGPSGACQSCPPGTFSTGYDSKCLACSPGWVSERTGGAYCRVCPTSTFAAGPTSCAPCPAGTLAAMPGSTQQQQCLDPAAVATVQDSWTPIDQVVAKVSAYYQAVSRRRSTQELDYGCGGKPPAPMDPAKPPQGLGLGTTYNFTLRALRNGPLSSCTVHLSNPYAPNTTIVLSTNATGFVSGSLSTPFGLAQLALSNCTEARTNRTGLNTTTLYAVLSPKPNVTAVLGPIAEMFGIEDIKDAGEYLRRYSSLAAALGVPIASFGSALEFATFDYEAATFNSTDAMTATKGALIYTNMLAVAGITNTWTSFLTPVAPDRLPNSTTNGTNNQGRRRLTGAYVTEYGIQRYLQEMYNFRQRQYMISRYNVLNSFFDYTMSRTIGSSSWSQLSSQSALNRVASAAYQSFKYYSYSGRRLLGLDATNADSYINAVAGSLSTSLGIQTSALQKLAEAVSSGDPVLLSEIVRILTVVNQAAAAQEIVAAAAGNLSGGSLSLTDFNAKYTGNALENLIYSQTVNFQLAATDQVREDGYNGGAAIGGAIGGFFGAAILTGIIVFVVRSRRQEAHVQPRASQAQAEPVPAAAPPAADAA